MGHDIALLLYSCVVYFSAICTTPERDSRSNKRDVGVDTMGTATCEHVEWQTHRLFSKFCFHSELVNCLLFGNFYVREITVWREVIKQQLCTNSSVNELMGTSDLPGNNIVCIYITVILTITLNGI